MKITLKALATVLSIVSLLTIFGCGGDPPPAKSIQDQQLEKLSATWRTSEVTLDGASKKIDYKDFALVLTGTAGATSFGYSVTGRPSNSPWPPSGSWAFGANPESQMVRDETKDKLDMMYVLSANGDTLQISFTFSGTGYPARVSNVKGAWVFTFVKA